ncbi:hypothetical protein [Halostella sp. PRR32]|uniref:hypothetical protein n=1 Tax=Halostella sp. PRR32 TaxID=3098147 RepID=UPI002B1DB944|nr:hypothetical protein [Halostella sp. PRR32]
MAAGYRIRLKQGGNSVTISPDDIASIALPREHTVINSWTATVPPSRSLEDWRRAEAFIDYVDTDANVEELIYRGVLDSVQTTLGSETRLQGRTVEYKLERGGDSIHYQAERVDDALRDAWSRTPFDATVLDPDVRTVRSGTVVQDATTASELLEVFSIPDETPAKVHLSGDYLHTTQTCWTQEGENADRMSGATTDPDAKSTYSGGQCARLDDLGDSAEWDFSVDHTIPGSDFGVSVRDDEGTDGINGVQWYVIIDGTRHDIDQSQSGSSIILSWSEVGDGKYDTSAGYDGGDVPSGTHTLGVECVDGGTSSEWYRVDVVAPYDKRFNYFWDNDNGGSGGYLDGPETHPDSVTVKGAVEGSEWNIPAAKLDISIDDASGSQALAMTNDGGANWSESSNTSLLSVDFTTVGTTIQGRVTLSRYGSRTTATPQQGFKSQRVSSWTLSIDENDLPVIDDSEFTGSYFEILQQLHERGGYLWTVDFAEASLPVTSAQPGQLSGSADWTRNGDPQVGFNDRAYANVVTVFGAKDDTGNRLTVTAKDDDEISAVGEEIPAPPLFETSVSSEDDLKNIARSELGSRVAEDQIEASVPIVPRAIAPGRTYQVPAADGKEVLLESVQFTAGGGNLSGTLEFGARSSLSGIISGVRSEVRRTKEGL